MIEGRAVQVLAEGSMAEPVALAEHRGRVYSALLAVPIAAEGRTLGSLEMYAVEPRPRSRDDVHRTRIVGHELSAAMRRLGENPVAVLAGGGTASIEV
jgi:GAF domain-containing protein